MRRPFNPEPTEIVDDDKWLELDRPAAAARGYVRGDESAADDWQPKSLGQASDEAFGLISRRYEIGSNCDSPIEVELGAAILETFARCGRELKLCLMMDLAHQDDGLLLVPQFKWSIYRSDWAILRNRKHACALLIECDGLEFHSSKEQRAHDAKKDEAALVRGHLTVRFSGSAIFRRPKECAEKVFKLVWSLP